MKYECESKDGSSCSGPTCFWRFAGGTIGINCEKHFNSGMQSGFVMKKLVTKISEKEYLEVLTSQVIGD